VSKKHSSPQKIVIEHGEANHDMTASSSYIRKGTTELPRLPGRGNTTQQTSEAAHDDANNANKNHNQNSHGEPHKTVLECVGGLDLSISCRSTKSQTILPSKDSAEAMNALAFAARSTNWSKWEML
jgi:hypothetical protein